MEKEQYIAEFVDIYGKLDRIAENKTEVALAIFQEINRDKRAYASNEIKVWQGVKYATDKQIDFMKRHRIEYPEGVTRQEASQLIDAFTNGKR